MKGRISSTAARTALFSAGVLAIGCAIAPLAIVRLANAADASAWDGEPRAAVRLIAGAASNANGATLVRAGIEVKLGPGWKTYWRYPGDSGVPPRFDFGRSENVQAVSVLWPAPHAFTDESGHSIGYKGEVIWPLHIVPRDPAKPVVLRLDLDYAVCEKLCVPADAKAELVLTGKPGAFEPALIASEARVPKPATLGSGDALAIKAVSRDDKGPHPRIIIDVAAPRDSIVELFAEGPAPDWALPIPASIDGAPAGLRRFAFDLDGVPPGASPAGAKLRLTATTGETAIEVAAPLD